MTKEKIRHEDLIHNAAYGAADKLVNMALSQKALEKMEVDDGTRMAMVIEVYKLNMFLVFGVLQDTKHRDNPQLQNVTDKLEKLYTTQQEEGLRQAMEELNQMPEAAKALEEAGLFDNPFEVYLKAINKGSKEFTDSPFGILADKISVKFFPEDLKGDAYGAFAYLLPQAAVEVIGYIDNPPERFEIIE
jgi:ribosomal protein L25 (general stress protein Ctc)